MNDSIQTFHEAALTYANGGYLVFPLHSIANGQCTCGNVACKSPGKHPLAELVPHGVTNATSDPAIVDKWWTAYPNANIGLATGKESNLVVVDVDVDKGGELPDGLTEPTSTVKTGGGFHYYFNYPENATVRNSASKLAKAVDVRGDGGYVVAPPSIHYSGKVYELIDGKDIVDLPLAWLEILLKEKESPEPKAKAEKTIRFDGAPSLVVPIHNASQLIVPNQIEAGTRNVEITKVAGSLRRIGLSENAIYSALFVENQRICQPPLDDSELHQIAHSVSRYKPNEALSAVSDSKGKGEYENTLKPYLLRDFFQTKFEPKEILAFHIGKRDIAIISAATNAGKTTMMRNAALCMAAGRPFPPFYTGIKPIKLAYFDFENDAQDVQRDLLQMAETFTNVELELLMHNFIVVPKGLIGSDLFQFNTHGEWASSLISENEVEFTLIDNISAAYDLNDENSNAEVTRKIIKPLLTLAYKTDSAFLFAHHFGKGKQIETEAAGVHAGRGASALQSLSRTVINMFGDVSKGEPVNVECAKRKTDGGQGYNEVMELREDRWFHTTTMVRAPKATVYTEIREHFQKSAIYTHSTRELIEKFESKHSVSSIKRAIKEMLSDGYIEQTAHGKYQWLGEVA